jgi:MEMO1 family protein
VLSTLEEAGPSLPRIARRAIEVWLGVGGWPEVESAPVAAAPVFVTLRTRDGKLRGCIGSTRPGAGDLVTETARVAVLAASRDPRFPPLRVEELADLSIEVSVLLPEEPVQAVTELDPERYGVILRHESGRQAVLLPSIPGISDASMQLEVLRAKAGLDSAETVSLSRFEVRKFCTGAMALN